MAGVASLAVFYREWAWLHRAVNMASVSVTGVLLGLLLVLDVTFNAAFCVLPAAMLVFISPKLSRILVETLGLASWSGFVAVSMSLQKQLVKN